MNDGPTILQKIELKPRCLHEHHRVLDILDWMERHTLSGMHIPSEWIDELRELVVRERERKASK